MNVIKYKEPVLFESHQNLMVMTIIIKGQNHLSYIVG